MTATETPPCEADVETDEKPEQGQEFSKSRIIGLLRLHLADPKSKEGKAELDAWHATASPREQAEWMAEASPPVLEAGPESGLEAWADAATKSEMEPYRPAQMPTLATWQHLAVMAQDLALASTVPNALKNKPADIALLLLVGHDVGIPASQSITKIHVIDGKPSMSSELMRALVLRAGHQIRVSATNGVGICRARRSDWPADEWTVVEFSLDNAVDAGMVLEYDHKTHKVTKVANGKDVWRKYTRNMLKARATSELVRDIFPDVVSGVTYTPEELGAEVDAEGEPIKVESASWTDAGKREQAERAVEPASDEERDEIIRLLTDGRSEEEIGTLREKWKAAGYGSLSKDPESKARKLARSEVAAAKAAIGEWIEEFPADAEVVDKPDYGVTIEEARASALQMDDEMVSFLLTQLGLSVDGEDDPRELLASVTAERVYCGRCDHVKAGITGENEETCSCNA